jgi:hypothetical protein
MQVLINDTSFKAASIVCYVLHYYVQQHYCTISAIYRATVHTHRNKGLLYPYSRTVVQSVEKQNKIQHVHTRVIRRETPRRNHPPEENSSTLGIDDMRTTCGLFSPSA